jgi:hypothetical protein
MHYQRAKRGNPAWRRTPADPEGAIKNLLKGSLGEECVEWDRSRHDFGYGLCWREGRTALAHRVSYEIHYGPIPAGLMVRHKCDNPPCVNPNHLELGTHADNMRDMTRRGRARCIPEEKRREIENLLKQGKTQRQIEILAGVSRPTIAKISRGLIR